MKTKTINKSFEGLRGVAALLVTLYHIPHLHAFSLFKAGYLAVDLFFVLSGFVISLNYLGYLQSTADFRDFVVARIARLMPLLLVAYATYFLIANSATLVSGDKWILPSVEDVIATVTMTFGIGLPHVIVYNFASWSISTEFYNYLLFALLCIAFHGRGQRRLYVFMMLSGLAGACVFAVDLLHHCGSTKACLDNVASPGAMARSTFGYFAGCVAFDLSRRTTIVKRLSRPIVQLTLAVSLCGAIALSTSHGFAAFAVPGLGVLLILSLSTDKGPISDLLRTTVPQSLGRLSYSLYLMHMPLLLIFENRLAEASAWQFVGWLSLFLTTLLLTAEATFQLVEMPGKKVVFRRFLALSRREQTAAGEA